MDVLAVPAEARLDSLREATARIQARWGSASLVSARTRIEERSEEVPAALAFGVPALDGLTPAGGLPLGRISLCIGETGSGRMLLASHLLAGASRECAAVLMVDLRGHLDPWLVGRLGARLERLLVMRPGRGENIRVALDGILGLVRAGVGCVVVDLPQHAGGNAAWESFAPALAASCAKEGAALLVVGETVSEPLRYASSFTLRLVRRGWVMSHGDVVGIRVSASVEKSKLGAMGRDVEFEMAYPLGALMPPTGITGMALASTTQARRLRAS